MRTLIKRYRKKIINLGVMAVVYFGLFDVFVLPTAIAYHDAPNLKTAIEQLQYIPAFHSSYFKMSQFEQYQLYVIPAFLLLYLVLIGWLLTKKQRGYRDRSDVGSHGTQRWATEKEIRDQFQQNDYGLVIGGLEDEKTKQVSPIFFEYQLGITSNQNVLVFGPAGSGKGASMVIPTLLSLADSDCPDSIVVTDPKGELFRKTYVYMRERGYTVKVFGFTETEDMFLRGENYNPIHFCNDMSDTQKLAKALLIIDGSNEWTSMALSVTTAILGFLRFGFDPEYATLINAKAMLTLDDDLENPTLGKMIKEWYQIAVKEPATEDIAREIYSSWRTHANVKAEGPRSSVRATINGALSLFENRKLARFLTKNTFDWTDFTEKGKTVTYIIMSNDPQYAPITRIFFMHFFQYVGEIADSKTNGELSRHLRFILDEFGNLGRIEGAPTFMALSRGRNTSVCPVIQDYSQLISLYGRAGERGGESNLVKNNTKSTLVLGFASDDLEGKEKISKLLGNQTIEVDSESNNNNGNQNLSTSFTGRPLMDVAELGRLGDDEYIFLGAGGYPIKNKKFMYFKNPKWSNITKIELTDLPIKNIELCDLDVDYFQELYSTPSASNDQS